MRYRSTSGSPGRDQQLRDRGFVRTFLLSGKEATHDSSWKKSCSRPGGFAGELLHSGGSTLDADCELGIGLGLAFRFLWVLLDGGKIDVVAGWLVGRGDEVVRGEGVVVIAIAIAIDRIAMEVIDEIVGALGGASEVGVVTRVLRRGRGYSQVEVLEYETDRAYMDEYALSRR